MTQQSLKWPSLLVGQSGLEQWCLAWNPSHPGVWNVKWQHFNSGKWAACTHCSTNVCVCVCVSTACGRNQCFEEIIYCVNIFLRFSLRLFSLDLWCHFSHRWRGVNHKQAAQLNCQLQLFHIGRATKNKVLLPQSVLVAHQHKTRQLSSYVQCWHSGMS